MVNRLKSKHLKSLLEEGRKKSLWEELKTESLMEYLEKDWINRPLEELRQQINMDSSMDSSIRFKSSAPELKASSSPVTDIKKY